MATLAQIRGMLLEEAVLSLLRVSGYRAIDSADGDQTLHAGSSGLEVKGRGEFHQIDAIADFAISQPFSNPQRLLLEAKFYALGQPVNLTVIRNAVGVLKDVSEYWVPASGPAGVAKGRYHYQYAVFSASGYTANAEKYAFAQDVYLIPLERSPFIRPVLDAIRRVPAETFHSTDRNAISVDMTALRAAVRQRIRLGTDVIPPHSGGAEVLGNPLERFYLACDSIGSALLGMVSRRFPIFLVPADGVQVLGLPDQISVRIHWDENGWYLDDAFNGNRLFSFDLPPQLFELYAEEGVLTGDAAIALKQQEFSHVQALVAHEQFVRVINFVLDPGWLERVRGRVRQIRVERDAEQRTRRRRS